MPKIRPRRSPLLRSFCRPAQLYQVEIEACEDLVPKKSKERVIEKNEATVRCGLGLGIALHLARIGVQAIEMPPRSAEVQIASSDGRRGRHFCTKVPFPNEFSRLGV